jgi:hypothetical protein
MGDVLFILYFAGGFALVASLRAFKWRSDVKTIHVVALVVGLVVAAAGSSLPARDANPKPVVQQSAKVRLKDDAPPHVREYWDRVQESKKILIAETEKVAARRQDGISHARKRKGSAKEKQQAVAKAQQAVASARAKVEAVKQPDFLPNADLEKIEAGQVGVVGEFRVSRVLDKGRFLANTVGLVGWERQDAPREAPREYVAALALVRKIKRVQRRVVVYADTSNLTEGQTVDGADKVFIVGVENVEGSQLASFKPFDLRDYLVGAKKLAPAK